MLELSFAGQLAATTRFVDAEFIVVSEMTGSDGGLAYDAERREWVPVRNFDAERWGFRNDPTGEEVWALMYNVMWITREGGIARRVAVGQIHVDAWNKVCPEGEEEGICLG